ncbi:MAG TPA: hypothetical protein VF810_00300 [Patescibacteria group bacterium]
MKSSKGKKTGVRRMNFNFRETHSERSATQSYKGFGSFIKKRIIGAFKGK